MIKIKNIQEMLQTNNGRIKNLKIRENFYEFDDESADPGMIFDIIGCYPSRHDQNGSVILMDFEPYIDYNKSIAVRDWRNNNSNPILTWFESNFYKKEGNEFYVDNNFDLEEVFKFKEFDYFTFNLFKGEKYTIKAKNLLEARALMCDILIGWIELGILIKK